VLTSHRTTIIALAARHNMPTIFSSRLNMQAGGLMSYGTNVSDMLRVPGSTSPVFCEAKG